MVSKRDFRKLDMATQAELRRVAVGMVQAGKTRTEASGGAMSGNGSPLSSVPARPRWPENGVAVGRASRGRSRQSRMKKIKGLITRKCPDQLGLPFALWTRGAVGLLIERETGVRFASGSTIGGYLHD